MPKQPCELLTTPFQPTKLAIALLLAALHAPLAAAELNTKLPTASASHLNSQLTVNLPSQTLDASLRQFSRQAEIDIAYDTALVRKIQAPEVKGSMSRREVLQKLLSGSGLSISYEGNAATITKTPEKDTTVLQLDSVNVRAKRFYEVGPLPGLGLTKEEIPGNVQSLTAKDIKEAHSLSLTDLMNRKLQSVTVNDYQGNPFQMDVQYRGFTAGPQIGTPQGLSVFFDGIRVNEPFGDVVNWDMIPMNALAGVDVFPGSNPIFGLNTLGGAFSMKTKDGFNNAGVDADVLTGSYGRKQLQVEGGWNNGTVALFGAGNFFLEDGWRKNSPSKVNQFFGKASYRGDKLDLNFSTLLVGTNLVGNGTLPSEMYARDRNASFTSEDETKNQLQQFQLSGAFQASDSFSITGQIYRRNSKRHQIGADAFVDYDPMRAAKTRPAATDGYTCMFKSTANPTDGSNPNLYGIPDYLVIAVNRTNGEFVENHQIFNDFINGNGQIDLSNSPGGYGQYKNLELPKTFVDAFKALFEARKNFAEKFYYDRGSVDSFFPDEQIDWTGSGFPEKAYGIGETTFSGPTSSFGAHDYFPNQNVLMTSMDAFFPEVRNDGLYQNFVIFLAPTNNATCRADTSATVDFPGPYNTFNPDTFFPYFVDGVLFNEPGYVDGTPTAVITDNKINQIVDGASLQFNWHVDKHKFMVGASIDAARAQYSNTQQLGFLDADRRAYLDPAQANPQFGAAIDPLSNNDFSGTNTTQSIYFSETWTPIPTWNFNVSARYNQTKTMNKIATRYGFAAFSVGDVRYQPNDFALCQTDAECAIPRNYVPSTLNKKVLDPAETEKFSYYSLNPSIGATWQAKENLNVYANIAQGTRTPSVIELGCALDHTPSGVFYLDGQGGTYQVPKSILENRSCSLPTTLSGDPYLPQIRSTSYDIGMRGTIGDSMQWNLGAYQTDLKDDIYFIAAGDGRGFFDTVGRTRRRGIEAGISGKKDRLGFGLNYSITDATFQDSFLMISDDNSSGKRVPLLGNSIIEVEPGDRMPGVALHNLNANISYEVTPKWRVGLSTVMHSESFLRGNENNEHKPGVIREIETAIGKNYLQPTRNPGSIPGYATFNFQTSYMISKEWTATMLINNLFDKEYFSAGRLGRNPFSPSINGAIGVSGYNHNSGDWQSTNFIAPGAPRGVWFSLNWHFVPD
jgi:outer membrane receptor protein involved in Fe transport